MKYFKKLVGERVYLSPICIEDAETYAAWVADPAVSDGLGNTIKVYSLNRERETLEAWTKNDGSFSIVKLDGDELIGNCGIFDINEVHSQGTIGLFIGEAKNRGMGYGQEVIRLLQSHAFETLRLNNLMLKVFSHNEAAIKCYIKCGFKEIGRRRQCSFLYGKYHDDVFMDILSEDYFEWKNNQC